MCVHAVLQAVSSGLLLYTVPFKSLNPSCHTSGIWSEALRITTHLADNFSSSFSDEEVWSSFTPTMMLESYRLARNQSNLKHAQSLIEQQILELMGEQGNPIDALTASTDIPSTKKLRIMRELAKLYASRGQPALGIDLLTNSIVSFHQGQHKTRIMGSLGSGSELAARSLLVMVKWMQSDSRLMQTVWNTEYSISQKMSLLLESEFTCRKARAGLYESASAYESYTLFQPDESVAKFDKHEYSMGQLLHLATMYCPELAKAWWSLAGWCYRIGRKNLEALR